MKSLRLLLALLLAVPAPAEAARVVAPKVRANLAPAVTLKAPALPAAAAAASLPALAAPAALPAAGPAPAALPQVQAMAEALPAAQAPAAEAAPVLSSLWDGAGKASMSQAVAGSESAAPALSPAELAAATSRLGAVPAPRVALKKALAAGWWAGLTSLAMGLHDDRVGPMIVGAVLGAMTGVTIQVFLGAMQQATAAPLAFGSAEDGARAEKVHSITRRVAASMGMPMPKEIKIYGGDFNQAYVQGLGPDSYTLSITQKLIDAEPLELEAVLRHELSHVKHRDTISRGAQLFLAPIVGGIALTAGVAGAPDAAIAALVMAAALSFPHFQKQDEYHADQSAAAGMGSAAPLVSFFLKDAEDPKLAASAVGGKAFVSQKGWARAWSLTKAHMRRLFSSHPAHDLRIARLGRLSAPPTGPPVKSIAKEGRAWVINGQKMPELGFGSFKRTVVHPDNPDYVVKIFAGWGDGPKEMRKDLERSEVGQGLGLTPRVVASGMADGLAYVVQERVRGAVESLPTPELLARLKKAGWELEDLGKDSVVRKNILRGKTLSGGEGLWLVDPDIAQVR